jgi:hypothetical protein
MTEGPLFAAVMAMVEAGDPDAEAYLMGELRRRADDPLVWSQAGTVLYRLGRWAEARTCLEQAVNRGERSTGTLAPLGFASYLTGAFRQSAECFIALLQEDPGSGECWRGLGTALAADGRYAEAVKSFEEAAKFLPDGDGIGDRIWRLHFQFGAWDLAWAAFDALVPADLEARWQNLHGTGHRLWRGEDLTGHDLVVFSHGGHGDTIQHFRWIGALLEAGATRITAIVQPGLVRLLEESPIRAQAGPERLLILAEGAKIEDRPGYFTWWEGIAARFRPRPGQAGWAGPYLAVPDDRRAACRQELGVAAGTRLVGLSWAGSPAMPEDRWRSITPDLLGAIVRIPGHRFVALQKGPLDPEERQFLKAAGIIDPSELIQDFADTASIISALDLVIAVDSAVAHLAGALGVETWLLNRASSEWRWGWKPTTSFWYPTLRIFNQAAIGEWSPVFDEVAAALNDRP